MRQRVGRGSTRSARNQAVALLGREGSRTRSQQRPSRSRAARRTSRAAASSGPTAPRLLSPCFGTERQSRVRAISSARQAAVAAGLPTAVAVARPVPHLGAAGAAGAASKSVATPAQQARSWRPNRSRRRVRTQREVSQTSPSGRRRSVGDPVRGEWLVEPVEDALLSSGLSGSSTGSVTAAGRARRAG